MTGLDGTPMPSFADNVKPDEAWDLVFYLRTLQPATRENSKERANRQATRTEADQSQRPGPRRRYTRNEAASIIERIL